MTEKALCHCKAVVYYYDPNTKGWGASPTGNEMCMVEIFQNTAKGTFRVIGRAISNPALISINSPLLEGHDYKKPSVTFGQWNDGRKTYGINFAGQDQAETFASTFTTTITTLSTPTPQIPPTTSPTSTTTSIATPPAPTPPPAPSAPPAPPAPTGAPNLASGGSGERGALLGSIEGFNKGGLKKTKTVDKSAPIVKKEDKSSVPSSGGSMMDQILQKRAAMGASGLKPTLNPTPQKTSNPIPFKPSGVNSLKKTSPVQPTPSSNPPKTTSPSNTRKTFGNTSSPSPSSSNNTSSITKEDLNTLKEEILLDVRSQLQTFKEELISALQQ